MPTIKLCVTGMHTTADEERVETALACTRGVFGVVASREEQSVEVDFEDDELTVDSVIETLQAQGFPARLAG